MTKIFIRKTAENTYREFEFYGHAGYAEAGEDIVCSAISMLVINTINSLETLCDLKLSVEADENKGLIRFRLPDGLNEKQIVLLDSLVLGVTGVEAEYGKKFCKVKFEEV